MSSQKIVFDERKFDHGINKLKILIFIENDEVDFEKQLNEVIEQSQIKILYNVGVNQLQHQIKTTVQDSLNPDQQTLINLSGNIHKKLFSDLMNIGIISGKQVNNSIKLLLTFFLKYENISESTFNSLYKHLDEKDKQDLIQDSKKYLAPVSNILQTTEINKNLDNDDVLQSDIIYNVVNQQSQIQSKFSEDKTYKSDFINKQSDRQCESKISEIKNDRILSLGEQVQSILYVQENVQGSSIISSLVPPGIVGSEGQNPLIQSEPISQQQLLLFSNIKQGDIQNENLSNLGPPNIETQKLSDQNVEQFKQSNDLVKSPKLLIESSVQQKYNETNTLQCPQHKLFFRENQEPIIQEPKLPIPIIFNNQKNFQELKCLK